MTCPARSDRNPAPGRHVPRASWQGPQWQILQKQLSSAQKRTPKQQRSLKTVERIKKAVLALLEEGGYSSFTLNKMAKQAKVNVATVCSYFPNKHNLLAVLTQDWLEERIAHLRRLLADHQQTTPAQARLQGRLIAEAVTAIIDLTETLGDAEKDLAERELHKMIRGYLVGCGIEE